MILNHSKIQVTVWELSTEYWALNIDTKTTPL
jgi:hypothetical protein